MTSVTDHLGNTTSYSYDLIGRRLTATGPRGYTTRYTYDRLNRLIAVAKPLGGAVRFEHDANSNRTKVRDRGVKQPARTTGLVWLAFAYVSPSPLRKVGTSCSSIQ